MATIEYLETDSPLFDEIAQHPRSRYIVLYGSAAMGRSYMIMYLRRHSPNQIWYFANLDNVADNIDLPTDGLAQHHFDQILQCLRTRSVNIWHSTSAQVHPKLRERGVDAVIVFPTSTSELRNIYDAIAPLSVTSYEEFVNRVAQLQQYQAVVLTRTHMGTAKVCTRPAAGNVQGG